MEKKEMAKVYDFTGNRILLAEDDALNAEMTMEILKNANVEVTCAKDGQEAVDLFEQSPRNTYDMIVLDLQMPKMSGIDVARYIRGCKHPQAITIPIIAITVSTHTEDVRQTMEVGMNKFLSKPIDVDELYGTLERFLGER